MSSEDPAIVKAFDQEAIQAGNFALGIDHEKVERKTETLFAQMSKAQKRNEIHGQQPMPIGGLFFAGGDESLGIEPWKMVDGPRGARSGKATAFPVAIARAATFDVELERRVGMAIGLEVAAKGGNVLLAPTINLLRHPGWGRAQETYSEDPHHTGAMGYAFICGAQNYVLTSPKHFALNNLENTRFDLSAEIDPRSLREVYLPHFRRCIVDAGAGSIMSAYNKINDVYCGENRELLEQILRQEWGFRGFVESDWFLGARSVAPSLHAGMNIEMPAAFRYSDKELDEAISNGELDEDVIERNARRSVYSKIAWQLKADGVAGKSNPDESVVECKEHILLAREAAEKSIVLLKNDAELLPLSASSGLSIAIVGDLAATSNLGDRGSSMVKPSSVVTPLDGIKTLAEAASIEFFESHKDLSRLSEFDVAIVVAGLTYRDEGEFIPTAQLETEGEDLARGGDRAQLDLPLEQRDLIERASVAAKKLVVVLQGGSAIVVRKWVDQVDALMMSWYGGLQAGNALARVLFGEVSPSGRLPVTFPRSMDQFMPWDVSSLSLLHDLRPGYRWLDHQGHDPEFPFGFGLGYTEFALGEMQFERIEDGFRARVEVKNLGSRQGATVVQVYVSQSGSRVDRVKKELKGFGRIELDPGELAILEFSISDTDLCFYDSDETAWELEACRYRFQIGQSSEDLPLASEWAYADGAWQQK